MSQAQQTQPVAGKSFTDEEINAALKRLVAAGKGVRRAVETILVMAVYDSIVRKSPVVANCLMASLRQSTKKDGIVAFLETHGQLYNKGGKTGFVHFALGAQAELAWTPDYVDAVQEAAEDWEAFKPTPEVKPLDVVKSVQSIIDKAEKEDAQVIDAGLVPYLKAVIAKYASDKALAAAQATSAAPVVVAAKSAKADKVAA